MIEANPFPSSMASNNSGCPIWEVSVEKKFTLCPVRRGERNSTTFRTCRTCLEDQPLTLYTIFDGKGTIFVNLLWKREQCTTFTCLAAVVLNYMLAASLESPDNQRARKTVVVCMQDKGFNRLASNKINLSVNEIKWSSLLARTHAFSLFISLWILDFGPDKLPGVSRNGPLARGYGSLVWGNPLKRKNRLVITN